MANDYEIKLKIIKFHITTGRPQLPCVCFIISSSVFVLLNHTFWVISMKETLPLYPYYFHFQVPTSNRTYMSCCKQQEIVNTEL